MKNQVQFSIGYDGVSVEKHEMNVKDFAPALLALGQLIEEANKILNGAQTKISVNIKATTPGSVEVLLVAHQDLLSQAVALFSSEEVSAFLNLRDILMLIFGGGLIGKGGHLGLLKLIRFINNRTIKSVIKIEAGNVKLELTDGATIVVKSTEIKLFQSLEIRKSVEAIIYTPLSKDGIDKLKYEVLGVKGEYLKSEAELFVAPIPEDEILSEIEIDQSLQLVSVTFQDGNKWRFNDGQTIFFAEVLDTDFLNKVKRNEIVFANDDVLQARLIKKQSISNGTVKAEYKVKKILNHRSAAVQIKLPFVD